MFLFTLMFFLSLLLLLLGIMFITLLERKILGFSQIRLGPNKISLMGLLQPLFDGVKFLGKELLVLSTGNKKMFLLSPCVFMLTMFSCWFVLFFLFFSVSFKLSLLFFLSVMGLSIYSMLFSSWSSNSKYGFLGSLRGISQSISYEIILSLVLFSSFFLIHDLSFYSYMKSSYFWNFLMAWPLIIIWCIMILGELNRAPFDFVEGESELVSGFNIEFGSVLFTILFVGEYGMLLFFSFFFSFFMNSYFLFLITTVIYGAILILFRSVYPRHRYDKFMYLTWFALLPVTIFWFFIIFLNSLI